MCNGHASSCAPAFGEVVNADKVHVQYNIPLLLVFLIITVKLFGQPTQWSHALRILLYMSRDLHFFSYTGGICRLSLPAQYHGDSL